MIAIATDDRIVLDGVRTALGVKQRPDGTTIYTAEDTLAGVKYREHPMPARRYSLTCPGMISPTGIPGLAQLEKDVRGLLARLGGAG